MLGEIEPIKQDIDRTRGPNEGGCQILSPLNLPTVSVVFATRHRPYLLQGLVDAVLSDPGTFELFVVVDGLDDPASVDVLSNLSETGRCFTYYCQEQEGKKKAHQRGVLAASGEVVLLLDDDVLPISHRAATPLNKNGTHGAAVTEPRPSRNFKSIAQPHPLA
jgi:hypothetical protein